MSQLPAVRAQKYFPSRAPSDILQWRDNQNSVLVWFNSSGIFHYTGDASGATPTHDAVTIISTGAYVGPSPSNPNLLLILWDTAHKNVVGWISGAGIPGGSLASLTNGNPIGWIDPSGTLQETVRLSNTIHPIGASVKKGTTYRRTRFDAKTISAANRVLTEFAGSTPQYDTLAIQSGRDQWTFETLSEFLARVIRWIGVPD